MTPSALYERQRALVRAGLLDAGEGWGPGSGVRTTAGSISLLLISSLCAEGLADATILTPIIADARPADRDRCPFTNTKRFQDAIESILPSRYRSSRVIEIQVSRTAPRSEIIYLDKSHKPASSEFRAPGPDEPGLRVLAMLTGDALRTIAKDVQAMIEEKTKEDAQ
jgi:hypothetical protein